MIKTLREQAVPYWRLSGFYFFYFAFLGAMLPYWNLYLADVGIDAEGIGWLTAILMATKVVAPSIWGWLADRTGKRLSIIRWGSGLAALTFAAVFYRQSFWPLAFAVLLYSFFWNAVLAQFEVLTLDHLKEHYARYSHIRVWGSIGFIAAVVAVGFLLDLLSLSLLPWLLLLILVGIYLSSLTISECYRAHEHQASRGLWAVIRRPEVLSFLLIAFLLQAAHGPYYTFYSIYLEGFGYSRSMIGLLWGLGVVAEVALFMVMHQLLRRFTLRLILLFTAIISAVRWIVIGAMPDSLMMLLLAQLAHAASFGSFHAVAIEFVRRKFDAGLQGQGQAIYSGVSFGLGGAVGAVSSGYLWSIDQASSFYLAGAASFLAVLICWLWFRLDDERAAEISSV